MPRIAAKKGFERLRRSGFVSFRDLHHREQLERFHAFARVEVVPREKRCQLCARLRVSGMEDELVERLEPPSGLAHAHRRNGGKKRNPNHEPHDGTRRT